MIISCLNCVVYSNAFFIVDNLCRNAMRAALIIPTFICLLLCGCGTYVPQFGEIWDDNTGTNARDIERLIKEKIYCEVQRASTNVNTISENSIENVEKFNPRAGNFAPIQPLPNDW